jgi:hypothetical protein
MTKYQTESNTLEQLFDWLKKAILWRTKNLSNKSYSDLLQAIPLPDIKTLKDSVFNAIVRENDLDEAEQLVLLLSLSPYYIPEFLNSFPEGDEKNPEIPHLFLNKSLINKSKYPSFETAMSLLGGTNICFKQEYFHLFSSGSKLFKEDIIAFPSPAHGEPFTRSNLCPGQSILSNILSGVNRGPEFSHEFPATLITPECSWDELVLDVDTVKQLNELKEWLQFEKYCIDNKISLSRFKNGYKSLFHGPPGTGKTLAASLLGEITGHKVYRIDLSSVVSKYIGETEKNLAKVFDRAAHGKWILFFDEADALFGKRGVTQNAHDRYANQEVSYLLQRFENYEGVSILATNFKENIDTAFYRRFHSIVNFKKPNADERLRLWNVHLPKDFQFAGDINLQEISQSIKLNGAGIYNVMRRSCMKAALNGDRIIKGSDMYESVKLEFAKENKTLTL